MHICSCVADHVQIENNFRNGSIQHRITIELGNFITRRVKKQWMAKASWVDSRAYCLHAINNHEIRFFWKNIDYIKRYRETGVGRQYLHVKLVTQTFKWLWEKIFVNSCFVKSGLVRTEEKEGENCFHQRRLIGREGKDQQEVLNRQWRMEN